MESTHCKLSSRFTDGLCSDHAHGLAHRLNLGRDQVVPVAVAAQAERRLLDRVDRIEEGGALPAVAGSEVSAFRGEDGVWTKFGEPTFDGWDLFNHDPKAWWEASLENAAQYSDFARSLDAAQPNAGHYALAELEQHGHLAHVITQNIDDLHERAGSSRVLHLHGEVLLARSTVDPSLVTPVNGPSLRLGDRCALGSQLRPHIVWFGEAVPLLDAAAELVAQAEILVVVGTSLQVYPAAGLVSYLPRQGQLHLVDPMDLPSGLHQATHWKQKASTGIPALASHLVQQLNAR